VAATVACLAGRKIGFKGCYCLSGGGTI